MQIDRLLFPITSLGPGNRLVLWSIGCSKKCYKCANPELWSEEPLKDVDIKKLVSLIKQSINDTKIEGITITGGDPLEQINELLALLPFFQEITDDVLVYTGYTINEVKNNLSIQQWEILNNHVSVLIDGPYIHELNDNSCVLRGSTNQSINYFDNSKKESYLTYMEKGRTIQNVFYKEKMISVGIHNKNS